MKNFAFTKVNYILIAISVLLIIVGFALMAGSSTTTEFNPDVFSFRRITLAPIVCMIGFFGMIIAIMWKKR
jgi:NADH:ubiquinone oxidoreductase subunit K